MASASLDVFSETSIMAIEERTLNDLPDEILLNILSHFGPEELCFIIATVCERWNILAKDVLLWKNLSYSCDNSSDISRINEVLTNAPALHSLIFREREDVARVLATLFHKHIDLRKLTLERSCLGEDCTGLLSNFVDSYPDLESLSLERCRPITSDGYSLIARLKKLFELNLSHCEGLSGDTIRLIADGCQNLQKLSLDHVRLTDDDVIHVINKLGKQLITLALFGQSLTDDAYSYLSNCARLQELEVNFCVKMTGRGLLDGIGSLQELTSLRLTDGHNLNTQVLTMFLQRPSMSSLVSLTLSSCRNLNDEELKDIAERFIDLKVLAVCKYCYVTDAASGG